MAATQDVSLRIEAGARHALIGPNGAGKTTLINLLTGVLVPSGGRIELQGADITVLPPHKRVRRGLVRTFQINQLFLQLTPLESVTLAASESHKLGARAWQRLGKNAVVRDEAADILERFRLAEYVLSLRAPPAQGADHGTPSKDP